MSHRRITVLISLVLAAIPCSANPVEEARARVAAEEYRFSWSHGRLQAPNRARGLRTRIDATAVAIVSRTEDEAGFLLRLELSRIGRPGALAPVAEGRLAIEAERAERRRPELTETFVNDLEGVRQLLTVPAPPGEGDQPLTLEFELSGGLLGYPEGTDGRSVLFRDGRGEALLRLGRLVAQDALERDLTARIELGPGRLAIAIDDREATYPIHVESMTTSAQWQANGQQGSARLGNAVSTAGDVNGDGYSDVIVGAYAFDAGEVDEGKVFVFLGGPAGLAATPAWTAESNQVGANLGSSVGAAGDINGDGIQDIVVGAFQYDDGEADEGAAFAWFGAPAPVGLGAAGTPANADWSGHGDQVGASFGTRVAGVGDIDGDGRGDFAVAAWAYDGSGVDNGQVRVYRGTTSGPQLGWTLSPPQSLSSARFGGGLSGAGDVNGDGYDDLLVGAPGFRENHSDEGAAFLYLGGNAGLSSSPQWSAFGGQIGAQLGYAVAVLGDVDGDHFADFAVGAPTWDGAAIDEIDQGRILLWRGGASIAALPSWTFASGQASAQLGFSLSSAGDVNGDGYADLIAGSDVWDGTGVDEGRAWLFYGRGILPAPAPSWTVGGGQALAYLGAAVSSAGDVNGDGFGDLVLGVYGLDVTQFDEGAARVFHGSAEGLPVVATWSPSSPGLQTYSFVTSAGDVDGDGYSDVIVADRYFDGTFADQGRAFVFRGGTNLFGAPPFATLVGESTGHEFGYAAAGVGDINGDGFMDIAIGAPRFTSSSIEQGAVYLYKGGPGGMTFFARLVGDQPSARFGSALAAAGDVDSDGNADVVIGAPGWPVTLVGGEGAAFLWNGTKAASPGSPVRFGASVSQHAAQFGSAVAGACDVDRNGFSDVVVGAPRWDGAAGENAGKLFLFLGQPQGLSTTPHAFSPEGSLNGEFASSVACAGDVNGDAYADLIVGEPHRSNSPSGMGAVSLFLGAANGPGVQPAWSFGSDQLDTIPAVAVASAGDLNSDGFSDVLVGFPQWHQPGHAYAGRALAFLGAATGLAATPAWDIRGEEENLHLGLSLSFAGDVNGDGFADAIVGRLSHVSALVYHANDLGDGGGIARLSGQAVPLVRNLAPLGITEADGRVLLGQSVHATRGGLYTSWLQLELKALGLPLDGTGFYELPSFGYGASFQIFDTFQFLPYRWRARTASTHPHFPRSPWYSIPDLGQTLTDFRSACRFPTTWFRDADEDGHGTAGDATLQCFVPPGFTSTSDDCDDTRAATYPGAPEVNDGLDNQCPGDPGYGIVDEMSLAAGFTDPGDADGFCWPAQPGATLYEAVRSGSARFDSGCTSHVTAATCWSDPTLPSANAAFHYLVHAVAPFVGSYGRDSSGVVREVCP